MSYTKQTWVTGDIITANKMNHMEDGIAGAGGATPLIVQYGEIVGSTQYLDTTFGDIMTAYEAGRPVIFKVNMLNDDPNEYQEYMLGSCSDASYSSQDTGDNRWWVGQVDFGNTEFPVAGIESEHPATIEALFALYPHVYSD